jgi:CRP-like cAMP-binding protein
MKTNTYIDPFFFKKEIFKPRTLLLQENQICDTIYFINTGCIRTWFNQDGRDITLQFFFENDEITSLESLLYSNPSSFNIETVEQCEVYSLSRVNFFLSLEDSNTKQWFFETAIKKMIVHSNRLLSLLKNKPAERYKELLENHPHIVKKIPQHQIASYLGITSVSLSRIRNRYKG